MAGHTWYLVVGGQITIPKEGEIFAQFYDLPLWNLVP